jgi:hypothetical protein
MLVDMARDIAGELQSNPKWQIEVAPAGAFDNKASSGGLILPDLGLAM